ncbi:hypothetical protein KDN32_17070 [Nocardioides sp. J2M5]|uniref:transglutaminase family protein n=1 Tax=Nocardioides palaemonis TaxID=2829810 RepID=UPI001BA4B04D|nr:transglutaminase domain-containing protein [Nocardioides palaemonis]MBS2939455.1 hypothetical protein [Nocardioides palaemonis]
MTRTALGGRLLATDVVLVVLLMAVATSPFADAYGGWRWLAAVAAGTLVGLGVALLTRRLGWGAWPAVLLLLGCHLLLGPALAVPDLALAGIAPDVDSVSALVTGLVSAWRDSLTLLTPLGSTGTVLLVPWVMSLVAGLAAGAFLWRSRRPGGAAIVVLAAFVVAAAFGDRVTGLTITRGLVLATGLLVWTRWRETRDVRVSWTRRLGMTAAVIAVAGGLAGVMTSALAGDTRTVLRDHVDPPFDPMDYPSPLVRYRAYYDERALGEKTMFTTTGLSTGDRIRIATMDTFDGIVWNVAGGPGAPTQSGTFGRLSAQPDEAGEQDVTITIEDYSGPWVPTVGETLGVVALRDGRADGSIQSRVLYNDATGTMAQLGGTVRGTTYEMRSLRPEVPASPEALAAASGAMPQAPADIPVLTKKVQEWLAEAGSPGGGAAAAALADAFRKGYYSDGKEGEATSPSGHGAKRITDLVGDDQMIGNDEQYASAMGVAAQQQGLPARVVIGFVVPDSTGVVKGADVHAWVEVHLEDAGWVAFVPTPDKDRTPQQQQEDPEPEPQPNVVQPPVIPTEPDDLDDKAPQGAGKGTPAPPPIPIGDILTYLAVAGGAVLLTSPFWALLVVKRSRRRRRRRAADPVARMSGGWREIADRARDLGIRLPHSNTRQESGSLLDARVPGSGVLLLAGRADRHVFGPTAPTDEEARAYWDDVDTALKRLRKSAPWWRRPLAVLSPASVPWRQTLRRAGSRVGAAIGFLPRRALAAIGGLLGEATATTNKKVTR